MPKSQSRSTIQKIIRTGWVVVRNRRTVPPLQMSPRPMVPSIILVNPWWFRFRSMVVVDSMISGMMAFLVKRTVIVVVVVVVIVAVVASSSSYNVVVVRNIVPLYVEADHVVNDDCNHHDSDDDDDDDDDDTDASYRR